jgi:hypothetical protein
MTEPTKVINLDNINKSAILSTMASELYHVGLNPRIALLTATAYVGAVDYNDDMEMFMEALVDGLEQTTIEVVGMEEQPDDEIDGESITQALLDSRYLCYSGDDVINDDIQLGDRLSELLELRSEAYAPALASEGITRRFGYAPTKYSELFKESIHALESSEYTVDAEMLSIAQQVNAVQGLDADCEGYVIRGCEKMNPELAYVSEFKGDRRGREYQASCHGPNGQSSDRSRALMNLFGVPMDYDEEDAMVHLRAEMADMVTTKDKQVRANLVRSACQDPVQFIIMYEGDSSLVKKPWSFVKAAKILVALHKGEHPYIGMAFGKDCKCSGPQLGSLMVGDAQLAAACGFTLQELEDAYHRCIQEVEKAGFYGLIREDIKKPFMGIFYGQGAAAFLDQKEISDIVWASIHGKHEILPNEQRAKDFHEAVTKSFGAKMVMVRNAFKSYSSKIAGKVSHTMPDGFKVAMNYKEKVNVMGEMMTFDTEKFDVRLRNNAEAYKFINLQMNTQNVHTGDFVRNGFVNMIQATDALLARLIIVHLKRLGAKHIISVHDCFRVNVCDTGKLDQAIINAYKDLFGSKVNEATDDMPLGTDILGMYFEGINKNLMEGEEGTMVSQFFSSGTRRLQKVNGVTLSKLIDSLGTSYYFDK